ncbi:hypothetical protein PYW08_015584 [Mythimna loreyi]|uniref:Uncharacterized protein n=1 Tax=Mythimna loreyi TaxID=667449 RepID=A0ACC2QX73_9NEOP|nr:hypothetical protein PYW08_015584 [Mythimna loreyi]
MGSQAILLIYLGLSVIQVVSGQLWEFGTDNLPTALLTTRYHGQFSFFQKQQHIQLIVPECHVVTFVRVQVENRISNPRVYYNYLTNTVTLTYKFWQYSPSTYVILAKAVRQPHCFSPAAGPPPRLQLGRFPAQPPPQLAQPPPPLAQPPPQLVQPPPPPAQAVNHRLQDRYHVPNIQLKQLPHDESHEFADIRSN